MIIEISVAVAVALFAILSIFIIRTLMSLQRSMRRVDQAIVDVEMKMRNFDSSLKALSNIGDICEQETLQLKQKFLTKHEKKIVEKECVTSDLAEWLIVSIKLGEKLLKRR